MTSPKSFRLPPPSLDNRRLTIKSSTSTINLSLDRDDDPLLSFVFLPQPWRYNIIVLLPINLTTPYDSLTTATDQTWLQPEMESWRRPFEPRPFLWSPGSLPIRRRYVLLFEWCVLWRPRALCSHCIACYLLSPNIQNRDRLELFALHKQAVSGDAPETLVSSASAPEKASKFK